MLVHHRGGHWYPLWFFPCSNPATEGSFSRLDEVGSCLFLFAPTAAIPKAHSYSFGSLKYPFGIVPRICGASKLATIGCFCHLFPIRLTSASNTDNKCDPIVPQKSSLLPRLCFKAYQRCDPTASWHSPSAVLGVELEPTWTDIHCISIQKRRGVLGPSAGSGESLDSSRNSNLLGRTHFSHCFFPLSADLHFIFMYLQSRH